MRKKGVSLIELLTVIVIISIISISLPLLFKVSSFLLKKSDETMTGFSDVRMCFTTMKTDLKSIRVSQKGTIYCIGTSSPVSFRFVSYVFDEGKTGICEIGYYLDHSNNTLRRNLAADPVILFQKELGDSDDEILCKNVVDLKIWYFDGTVWKEEWDASISGVDAGKVPVSIKFKFSLFESSAPGNKRDFYFQVDIPTA
ncbi:prepilin-type N-terminal cleavage/methylation domain-containing protein [bacterium]|nr:prepilin-type N-terminal cleavage/methylation domain-containing protein [bacterium]